MKQLLIFTMILLCSGVQAQIESFDISKYVYPDIKRTTFSLSPDLYLNNRDLGNSSYSNASLGLNSSLYTINYNRSFQSELSISGDLGLDFSSKDTPNNPRDGMSVSTNVNYDLRKFYKPKRFFELEPSVSVRSLKNKEDDRNSTLSLGFSPKLGRGRIEIVSDAWLAKTLFQFLAKNNLLLKEPSDEEINNLAVEITEIGNLRVIDFRLERIAELERLIKYFIDNEFVNPENYAFYPILLDAYSYESFTQRTHGSTFKYGLNVDVRKNLVGSDYTTETSFYNAVLEFEKANAISTTWQFDQKYSLEPGIYRYRYRVSQGSIDLDQAEYIDFVASLNLGNYLSRRTYFGAELNATCRKVIDGNSFYNLNIAGNYDYYLSPSTQLKLRLNFRLTSSNSVFSLPNYHQETLSWSLVHYLR